MKIERTFCQVRPTTLHRDEVEPKVDFSRRLVGDIVIVAAAMPTYGSRLNQSRCKKGENGTKQRKSLGISIGEERRAPGNGRAQSLEPEWPHGKKDLDSRLSSPGWLPLCPDQPPTAKNLIRCHNYIQWCSTPPDSPSLFSYRSFSFLVQFGLHFLENCALVYVEDSLDTLLLSLSFSLSHTNSTKSFVQAL